MLMTKRCRFRRCLILFTACLWLGLSRGSHTQNEAAGQTATSARLNWPALKPFEEKATWPTPALDDDSYGKWITLIRPTEKDLKWRKIRWHKSLSAAAEEAKRLQRPILLWTMNGHPCGET